MRLLVIIMLSLSRSCRSFSSLAVGGRKSKHLLKSSSRPPPDFTVVDEDDSGSSRYNKRNDSSNRGYDNDKYSSNKSYDRSDNRYSSNKSYDSKKSFDKPDNRYNSNKSYDGNKSFDRPNNRYNSNNSFDKPDNRYNSNKSFDKPDNRYSSNRSFDKPDNGYSSNKSYDNGKKSYDRPDNRYNSNKSYDDSYDKAPSKRRQVIRKGKSVESASWMDRNKAFGSQSFVDTTNVDQVNKMQQRQQREPSENKSFRQEFRGTRVFVQGLPLDASWQDVKDHFRVAGEVVFASVSIDTESNTSKGHGIVQFETTDMAQNAINIMRDHPMSGGYKLFVRPDYQESNDDRELQAPRNPNKSHSDNYRATKDNFANQSWRCANEENADHLTEDMRDSILSLIRARNDARRRRNFDAADKIREDLKLDYGVHLDDRLRLWWTATEFEKVPSSVKEVKGEGRWNLKPWRQIPTTPENDACVNPDLVNGLLSQRDIARREKDFNTADSLLEQARDAPDGELYLRIHDESRTWRIWTDEAPIRSVEDPMSPVNQCMAIIREHAPEKKEELENLLLSFPGREYNILRKLKQRYLKNRNVEEYDDDEERDPE